MAAIKDAPYFWHQMEKREPAGPSLQFDFDRELAELRTEKAWAEETYNAKTLVKYLDLRIVLMLLKGGASIKAHQAPGRIAMQVLDGHIQIHVGERKVDLQRGQLLALDAGVQHDVNALEESAMLLTVLAPT